jgi:hypothetical protein
VLRDDSLSHAVDLMFDMIAPDGIDEGSLRDG